MSIESRERASGEVFCGIHHVQLSVAALERSADFYSAIGFASANERSELNLLGLEGAWFNGSNVALRLMLSRDPAALQWHAVNTPGITHICMQAINVSALYERFAAAGAHFHSDLVDLGTGFLYAYARDREHNVFELEGVPPVINDTDPWIAHVNIATLNIERLANFYAGLFCDSSAVSPRFRNNPKLDAVADLIDVNLRMAWVLAGNAQIEFSEYTTPRSAAVRNANAPGYGCVALQVTHLANAMARVTELGGRVSAPAATDSHIARCVDPDGNSLLLLDLSADQFAASRIDCFPDPIVARRFADARSNAKTNL